MEEIYDDSELQEYAGLDNVKIYPTTPIAFLVKDKLALSKYGKPVFGYVLNVKKGTELMNLPEDIKLEVMQGKAMGDKYQFNKTYIKVADIVGAHVIQDQLFEQDYQKSKENTAEVIKKQKEYVEQTKKIENEKKPKGLFGKAMTNPKLFMGVFLGITIPLGMILIGALWLLMAGSQFF